MSSIARKSPLISPFKKLAVSNLAAHMSDQIALIAIPLVAVTALDAGGGATSIIQMLNTLPYLLLAVPFGLLVDRGRRRGIMTAGELVRTLTILVLIVLAFTDAVSLTALTALGVAGSIGTVAYSVAVPNAVRDLVPPDSLARTARSNWPGALQPRPARPWPAPSSAMSVPTPPSASRHRCRSSLS